MKIWKCEAMGDVIYIQAADKAAARARLFEVMGPMPDSILSWSEVKTLPEGEEFLQ